MLHIYRVGAPYVPFPQITILNKEMVSLTNKIIYDYKFTFDYMVKKYCIVYILVSGPMEAKDAAPHRPTPQVVLD